MSRQIFRVLVQADWIETNDESGLVVDSGRTPTRVIHRDHLRLGIGSLIREVEESGEEARLSSGAGNREIEPPGERSGACGSE